MPEAHPARFPDTITPESEEGPWYWGCGHASPREKLPKSDHKHYKTLVKCTQLPCPMIVFEVFDSYTALTTCCCGFSPPRWSQETQAVH